jgi:hypothetical protein
LWGYGFFHFSCEGAARKKKCKKLIVAGGYYYSYSVNTPMAFFGFFLGVDFSAPKAQEKKRILKNHSSPGTDRKSEFCFLICYWAVIHKSCIVIVGFVITVWLF